MDVCIVNTRQRAVMLVKIIGDRVSNGGRVMFTQRQHSLGAGEVDSSVGPTCLP